MAALLLWLGFGFQDSFYAFYHGKRSPPRRDGLQKLKFGGRQKRVCKSKKRIAPAIYRVSQLPVPLDLVDLDFDCTTLFPILLGPVGIWHNRFGNLAR